ncbi:hydroxypyruvate isomerase family protein [Flindersiella endophytica]
MGALKQSFAWWSFARNGIEPEELVAGAARIGYAATELVGPDHWQLVKDHGLRLASYGGHASIESGLNRRENHDRIEREILTNLELAQTWGIANLICFSGSREGLSDEAGIEATAEGLRRVAPAAEEAGVTLVLELLNSKVDHPDYHCDRSWWGLRVVEQVGSPRVKLLYDIYHMQIMEGDLIRTIQDHHRSFGHYHTAGNPGRHDLDDSQEMNYPPIFRAIAGTGYDGFVGHEFVPRGEPVQALRAAYEACEQAVTAVSG